MDKLTRLYDRLNSVSHAIELFTSEPMAAKDFATVAAMRRQQTELLIQISEEKRKCNK